MEKKLEFIHKTNVEPNKELKSIVKRKRYFSGKIARLDNKIKEQLLFENPRLIIESIYEGSRVKRKDHLFNYVYTFDYETGVSTRSDILTADYKPSGKDPFYANFPHLIDVGIMGHCTHGLSGLCMKSGVQCYQNGLNINKPNMSVEDFRKIAEECKDLTNQFALGGRGDPNEHEHFGEILAICRENNIVPNYTTSGFRLTDEEIAFTKKYCGAVAVSWYRSDYTLDAILRFVKAGVKTNIHFVLNNDTIEEAIGLLENNGFPAGINAVVFLTHKPVGLGQKEKCLRHDDVRLERFISLIRNKKFNFKIGIDGCFVVSLINSNMNFNMKYLDTCEATRFTCYIDADLNMYPCSFDVNEMYKVSLRNSTILKEWHGDTFNKVRMILKKGCPGCKYNSECHGGCFLHKDMVLCKKIQEDIL